MRQNEAAVLVLRFPSKGGVFPVLTSNVFRYHGDRYLFRK